MPTSDSDDFESADEGQNSPQKKERKKRLSSSNYSDNLESDQENRKGQSKTYSEPKKVETTDGWDDFDIDEGSEITKVSSEKDTSGPKCENTTKTLNATTSNTDKGASNDSGWTDFDDWGDTDIPKTGKEDTTKQPAKNIEEVTERLAATSTATSTKNEGWGWGWGMDSILSTATAGITNLTTQVSQGISTVLETSIGAPDPEELARKASQSVENKNKGEDSVPKDTNKDKQEESTNSDAQFPFGSLLSGVTKFVETTGTKVLAGGLDTLETIGKKTMEVLQDGDPGLAKKRAMLGLDSADKPVLSQVLREAKAKADEEDRIKEQKREAKEVHYETLFDDFEGLVHLEALEMLSRQVSMRIEERIRAADPSKRQDIKETLQQVAELCEMPEEDDDEEESGDTSRPDALHERLQTATRDIGLKMQYQPLIKHYKETLEWLSTGDISSRAVYKRGVSSLAHATALAVETYHKTAEMLLVKTRRSTADEADALTQMTVVITKHIGDIATLFTARLNSITDEDKEQVSNHITNIFLEADNSCKYIQNAFQLALPIIQIGAV
ncbi:PREDICTED: protein FAM114A2 isoform X2 [Papilio xuthus]|uniref:Protein FAM114A2 isoform X2 n=1 Tax=Papilio xuthus TaxID=66420 RepID=A0AAJ7ECE9_PAPXU|nr:PREDICTED: protein FAM114A2 isoform X2 [Papilio xuthus]